MVERNFVRVGRNLLMLVAVVIVANCAEDDTPIGLRHADAAPPVHDPFLDVPPTPPPADRIMLRRL